MKKSLFLLFLCLSNFLAQAISDEALLKYGPRVGKATGAVVGGIAGGVGLGATGYGIMHTTVDPSGEIVSPQAKESIKKVAGATGAIMGEAIGAMAGVQVGEALANKRLIAHFQKKYNINPRLAQAFVQTKTSPANAEMRRIFEAALDHDTNKIKTFLSAQYSKKFGSNWQNIILNTITTFLEIDRIKVAIKLKKETTFKGFYGFAGKEISNMQKLIETLKAKNPNYNEYAVKLLSDANLLAAISDLYFRPLLIQSFMRLVQQKGILSREGEKLAKGTLLISSLFGNKK